MFSGIYSGRRVLITGHTGFKGAWLASWLLDLGAVVGGLSIEDRIQPLYRDLGLDGRLQSWMGDVADLRTVDQVLSEFQPEVVFHLAAQPLVRESYRSPLVTWRSNVMGTATILEAIRSHRCVKACVVATSDKCYENREQIWGYREGDALGGHDPYSASKGSAELAVASWRRSYFSDGSCLVASARAGNVIGGGDRAAERLVVEFIEAMERGEPLRIRRPAATRPWQHVLEPLSGYLWLGAQLFTAGASVAEAWNFGPDPRNVVTVRCLADALIRAWGSGSVEERPDGGPHEAGLLMLDCSKARQRLHWWGVWDLEATVAATVAWYREMSAGGNAQVMTSQQIAAYVDDARGDGVAWSAS